MMRICLAMWLDGVWGFEVHACARQNYFFLRQNFVTMRNKQMCRNVIVVIEASFGCGSAQNDHGFRRYLWLRITGMTVSHFRNILDFRGTTDIRIHFSKACADMCFAVYFLNLQHYELLSRAFLVYASSFAMPDAAFSRRLRDECCVAGRGSCDVLVLFDFFLPFRTLNNLL